MSRHGWQYQFFTFASLALVLAVTGTMVIPAEAPKKLVLDRRVDWLGAVIITFALSLFSFSITQGGLVRGGWTNACGFAIPRTLLKPDIPVLFVLSFVFILAFGLWQHYVTHYTTLPPIIRLSVFHRNDWKVTAILGSALTAYTAINVSSSPFHLLSKYRDGSTSPVYGIKTTNTRLPFTMS